MQPGFQKGCDSGTGEEIGKVCERRLGCLGLKGVAAVLKHLMAAGS